MLYLTLLFSLLCLQNESNETLASLNYWELSKMLVVDERMQDALSVDPEQVERIRLIRKSFDIDKLFWQSRMSNSVENLQAFLLEFDSKFIPELQKVLDETQIRDLRRKQLRCKHPTAIHFFLDREVLDFAKVSKESRVTLSREAKNAIEQLFLDIEAKRIDAAIRIVEGLSSQAKEAFAQYAGNLYLPSIRVSDVDIDNTAIPFPNFRRFIGTLDLLGHDPKIQKELSLTSDQVSQIQSLETNFNDEIDNHVGGGLEAFWKKKKIEWVGKVTGILTRSQLTRYARIHALREFNLDFNKPFSRVEFLNYLGYKDPEEIGAIRRFVEKEKQSFEAKVEELNRKYFNLFCNKLSLAESKSVRKVFDGDW